MADYRHDMPPGVFPIPGSFVAVTIDPLKSIAFPDPCGVDDPRQELRGMNFTTFTVYVEKIEPSEYLALSKITVRPLMTKEYLASHKDRISWKTSFPVAPNQDDQAHPALRPSNVLPFSDGYLSSFFSFEVLCQSNPVARDQRFGRQPTHILTKEDQARVKLYTNEDTIIRHCLISGRISGVERAFDMDTSMSIADGKARLPIDSLEHYRELPLSIVVQFSYDLTPIGQTLTDKDMHHGQVGNLHIADPQTFLAQAEHLRTYAKLEGLGIRQRVLEPLPLSRIVSPYSMLASNDIVWKSHTNTFQVTINKLRKLFRPHRKERKGYMYIIEPPSASFDSLEEVEINVAGRNEDGIYE